MAVQNVTLTAETDIQLTVSMISRYDRNRSRLGCAALEVSGVTLTLCLRILTEYGTGKADRRPIDPPPIIQLRVLDPSRRSQNAGEDVDGTPQDSYALDFLQNPYYFMFASLAKPDSETEVHFLKVLSLSLSHTRQL